MASAPEQPTRRFQFGMQGLLYFMAAISVVFAVFTAIGPVWGVLLGWCMLLVAAHVFANVWCSRPHRTASNQPHEDFSLASPRGERVAQRTPATRLSRPLHVCNLMHLVPLILALAGATLGVCYIVVATDAKAGIGGLLLGGISASIIGGLCGFLCSRCLGAMLQAWNDAVRASLPVPAPLAAEPEAE